MPEGRSLGLILAGAVQIAIGAALGLILLYVALRPNAGAALAAGGIATVYFFTVGIGSFLRRRWAQALSLVVSSMWLAAGVVATLLVAVLPHNSSLTAGAFVVMIVVPLALVAFYARDAVRLECEAVDAPRWTDRVPLPVLAVVIMLAFGSVTLIASLSNAVLPIFGVRLTGAPAALGLLGLAILSAWLAVRLYDLHETAWWTLVLLQLIGCVGGAITLVRGAQHSSLFIAIVIAAWLAYFAYLLFIHRYFALGVEPRTRRGDVRMAGDQFTFSG